MRIYAIIAHEMHDNGIALVSFEKNNVANPSSLASICECYRPFDLKQRVEKN